MATKKELGDHAGKLDGFFSDAPKSSIPEIKIRKGVIHTKDKKEPQKAQKKVFSFRAEVDQAKSWRVWADAKGLKVEELGTLAIKEYIRKHPLTDDQKKIYELKLAQKKS